MLEVGETGGLEVDIGEHIMRTLVELLEDQTGFKYTYEKIEDPKKDKTA